MFATFYSFYMALFCGEWSAFTTAEVTAVLRQAWLDLITILTNALGGAFTEAQTLTLTINPEQVWACVLSLVTLTGLCALVWKVTKYIFGIFFGGWQR